MGMNFDSVQDVI